MRIEKGMTKETVGTIDGGPFGRIFAEAGPKYIS